MKRKKNGKRKRKQKRVILICKIVENFANNPFIDR